MKQEKCRSRFVSKFLFSLAALAVFSAPGAAAGPGQNCLMISEAAKITDLVTEGGAALRFEAERGSGAKLQTQLQAMVDRHNSMHASGQMGNHGKGSAMNSRGMGLGKSRMVDSLATYTSNPSGGTITFVPISPEDLEILRDQVRMRKDFRTGGACN